MLVLNTPLWARPALAATIDAATRGRQRGIALIAVLWIVVLLSIVAASFMTETRTDTRLARNLIDITEAEALADAGVLCAINAKMRSLIDQDFDDFEDDLGEPVVPVSQAGTCELSELSGDGTLDRFGFAGGEVWISVQDDGGKIDLNIAPEALLRGLFLVNGLDQDQADAMVAAIADFVDDDHLAKLNGAEDGDYASAGLAWGAKDAPFESVAELQQVMGMTAALYERVAPVLTVRSGRPGIDPETASREALMALPNVSETAVDALIEARVSVDGDGLLPELSGADDDILIPSSGRFFTILAEAHTASGAIFVREAAVEILGSLQRPFITHGWQRGARITEAVAAPLADPAAN